MNSIRKRFLFSAGANIARAAVSLAVGLLVARGLGPADYGNLAYLLGSFWAIRALLDMGSSSAFYTFIAQRGRSCHYYFVYFGWVAFQFLFSVALVAVLLPSAVVDRFWLGQDRELILLALLATFLQNQVWQTVVQLHEAERKTIRIQLAGLAIILIHLALVALMLLGHWLSVRAVLWAIVGEYFIAAVWLSITLRHSGGPSEPTLMGKDGGNDSLGSVVQAYFRYCRPMAVIAVFSFCYEMADRWLLQHYGGARQQGFYQIAAQLSTVSLLATTSVMNIFWKEIAEASERGDHARVVALHQKTTHLLVFVASVVSCFLAPWAEQLVDVLLGQAYHAAWPVLFLMLFYPIHQAMGQINGTLFMATARNTIYMKITVAGLLIGIPISYLLVAPVEGGVPPGLDLGAMGLAIKIVGLNIIFVNIQSWMIARHYSAGFKWRYQILIIFALLSLGYLSRYSVEWIVSGLLQLTAAPSMFFGLGEVVLSGLIYLTLVAAVVMHSPRIAGLDKNELVTYCDRARTLYRRGKGWINGR